MVICIKKLCPYCSKGFVKKNGLYSNGKQRWFCLECRKSFHWQNQGKKHSQEQVWFERWVYEGYSIRQLSDQSGHSKDKLYSIINHWLESPKETRLADLDKYHHLVFDGTFLHRPKSIVVLMDADTNSIIAGKYGINENNISQLTSFLGPLKDIGLAPISCTTDGNPQAIQTLKNLWPGIILQRCVVHVQRQGLMRCRQKPTRTDARLLRSIFLKVSYISSALEKDQFIEEVREWEQEYGHSIQFSADPSKVMGGLKKAHSMLTKALPDMFHYLDNIKITSTTNSLEGYFSRLKAHYRNHRGLSNEKLNNYFTWYFFFRPK